jgi:hypothetical protein
MLVSLIDDSYLSIVQSEEISFSCFPLSIFLGYQLSACIYETDAQVVDWRVEGCCTHGKEGTCDE